MIFIYIGPGKADLKNGKIADHHAVINDALRHHGFETTYTDTITDSRATPNDLWIGNLSKVHRDWALEDGEEIILPKKFIIWYVTPVRSDNVVDLQINLDNKCGLLSDANMIITYESAEIHFYKIELGVSKRNVILYRMVIVHFMKIISLQIQMP